MRKETVKSSVYWVTTILGPASFVIGGAIALSGSPQVSDSLAHLGYPAYFAVILGVAKLSGAVVTVVPGLPRLKEWAYAGFCFELLSAAFSHAAVGDPTADVVAPLGFLGLVLASWALRPAGRRVDGGTRERTVDRTARDLSAAAA